MWGKLQFLWHPTLSNTFLLASENFLYGIVALQILCVCVRTRACVFSISPLFIFLFDLWGWFFMCILLTSWTLQDPLVTKGANLVPLLGIDVWEHAYYLQVISCYWNWRLLYLPYWAVLMLMLLLFIGNDHSYWNRTGEWTGEVSCWLAHRLDHWSTGWTAGSKIFIF